MLNSGALFAGGAQQPGLRTAGMPNLAAYGLLDDAFAGQQGPKKAYALPPLDSLSASQQAAVAQQLVARMTPEQQAVVAQLAEKEQLRVLTNFYERLFIPPRAPPWQPSGALLAALLQQRREQTGTEAVAHKQQQQQQPAQQQQQQQQQQQVGTPRFQAAGAGTSAFRPMGSADGNAAAAAAAAAAAVVKAAAGQDMSSEEFGKLQVLAALAVSPSPAPGQDPAESSPSKRTRITVADAAAAVAAGVGGAGQGPVLHLAEALTRSQILGDDPAAAAAATAAPLAAVGQFGGQPPTALQVWAELRPYAVLAVENGSKTGTGAQHSQEGAGEKAGSSSKMEEDPGEGQPGVPPMQPVQQQQQPTPQPAPEAGLSEAAEGQPDQAQQQQQPPQQQQPEAVPAPGAALRAEQPATAQPAAAPFLDLQLVARFCAAYATHPPAQRQEELQLIRALIGQGELQAAKAALGFYAGMQA